ncbi:sulfite exporter TauE/SafE family protein [Porticoccus sp. GXU_MW_L64]
MAELSTANFAIVVVGSYLAAFINAAFGLGGAMLMLAMMTSLLPIQAVIPLHSPLMFGSLISRIALYWKDIYWPIAKPFSLGCLIGVFAGAQIYVNLPDWIIALVLGVLMLSVWVPDLPARNLPKPFFWVGAIHSFLSTVFAYGGVFHAVILRTKLQKQQVVATIAGSLLTMGILKMTGYMLVGFDYRPYLPLIAAVFLVSYLGTWTGKQVLVRVSEQNFRLTFKLILTFFGCRLLYQAWNMHGV